MTLLEFRDKLLPRLSLNDVIRKATAEHQAILTQMCLIMQV